MILVIASGRNRVNEERLGDRVGEPLVKADANFVRSRTGFVIGGGPPVRHPQAIETWIDAELLQYGEIWAAAGHPHAVFRLTPDQLVAMTAGQVVPIA